ncbi:PREDICTED: LOW QUALITY PROTEIN: lck-interacting transmembrane adapter 1 [Miniopterus natalensis]|uniref:LOW QUALITY PROTEIN: lck-interacting transmembrane adapter 1 n=1 Tax=Miniopterus natalensis TaxID=291302 RepID=UPI0007A6F366|nr:PREDICTED: LOW QUALITY PROTEIN: lck-interacting transmembrane adapter 1 [Miniopterus natalensis]
MALDSPGLHRMGPLVPSAPPVFWVLGCLALLFWLWVLCTACHRKQARKQQARLQGSMMPAEAVSARLSLGPGRGQRGPTCLLCPQSLLRRPHLCILSKSDTRLHELHRGPLCGTTPRPASMDLLRPQCLEVYRGITRPPSAFSHRELPQTSPATNATQPSMGPEATYSNVGLAAIPRASLAASRVVLAGARLTSSCARPGPEARPVVAEYACIQKLKGADWGPQGLEQGKAQETPDTQVDILYSRISRPKRRDPGSPAVDQPDPKDRAAILTLGRNLDYEALPLRGLNTHRGLLENVYESIQEMGAPEYQQPPIYS